MWYAITFLGLLLVAAEWAAARHNAASQRSGLARPIWLALFRYKAWVGLPLGVAVVFVSYSVADGGPVHGVIGIPFPAIFLDATGRDYVGIFTPVAIAANVHVGYKLPELLLWMLGSRRVR